ncbi:MAG: hypothetical protein ABIA66_00940 [Candidatus Omnitrophota bacterium]
MQKCINIIVCGIMVFFISSVFLLSFAEETLTVTTYYPSPYGSYNELTTADNTYLATTGGSVGIGTTSPQHKVQIGEIASTSTATPDTLSLGGTYSDTAGANPKLRVYYDGTNSVGLGVTSAGMEYIVPASASEGHIFYVGSSDVAHIGPNGEASFDGISGDGNGKAVCIKSDGNLGTCTNQPDASGVCNCS